MQWQDRIENYARQTGLPDSLFIAEDRRVLGTWMIGPDYRAMPNSYDSAGYLKRLQALFPEKQRTLHLFSSKADLDVFPGDTVGRNPELRPTFVDDVQTLERVPLERYDLVLADPPTRIEDSARTASATERNSVMSALRRLRPGAHVVWIDQLLPPYRKDAFAEEATISIWNSARHPVRGATVFRRVFAH
jgi:hypothetical protein